MVIRRLLAVAVVLAVVLAGLWAAGMLPPWLVGILPGVASEPPRRTDVGGLRDATGVRVVDGDTLDVKLGKRTVRVRLLNVDAPEVGQDDQPGQCLAKEATVRLRQLAGKGRSLRLETFGEDRFGRTLAAVYGDRNILVNAEMVRAGLAAPLVVDGQEALIESVRAAQQAAAAAGAGLHARTGCTLSGRLSVAEFDLHQVPMQASGRSDARKWLDKANAVSAEIESIGRELEGNERNAALDALTNWEQGELKARVGLARTRAAVVISALQSQT